MPEELLFTAKTVAEYDIKRATADALVQQIQAQAKVPQRIKRIAARSTNWDIPRSFVGYRADPTVQALGFAPKWILKSEDGGPGSARYAPRCTPLCRS
jgi:hypothetical protein